MLPPPQPAPTVEADYDNGSYAEAAVVHETASHYVVRFLRREPEWCRTMLALENDTLEKIATTNGYHVSLLSAANPQIKFMRGQLGRLQSRTLIRLPAVAVAQNDETPRGIATRHRVHAAEVVRGTKAAYQRVPELAPTNISELQQTARLEHGTQLLLPEYRPRGPAPARPHDPPADGDAHAKARRAAGPRLCAGVTADTTCAPV